MGVVNWEAHFVPTVEGGRWRRPLYRQSPLKYPRDIEQFQSALLKRCRMGEDQDCLVWLGRPRIWTRQ
jgi:hypothetical protein